AGDPRDELHAARFLRIPVSGGMARDEPFGRELPGLVVEALPARAAAGVPPHVLADPRPLAEHTDRTAVPVELRGHAQALAVRERPVGAAAVTEHRVLARRAVAGEERARGRAVGAAPGRGDADPEGARALGAERLAEQPGGQLLVAVVVLV